MLGDIDPKAQEYLVNNLDSIKDITEVEKRVSTEGLANISNKEDNLEFYKKNVFSGIKKDINQVIEDKGQKLVADLKKLEEQGFVQTAKNIKDNMVSYIKSSTLYSFSEDAKRVLFQMAEDMQVGAAKLTNITTLTPKQISKVYNISENEAEAVRSAIFLSAFTALGSVGKKGAKSSLDLGVDGNKAKPFASDVKTKKDIDNSYKKSIGGKANEGERELNFVKKWSIDDLKALPQSDSKGIKKLIGNREDGFKFFKNQIDVSTMKEVKSGVFIGKDSNGLIFTYRAVSKSGPPTIDINGIKGIRKIKFLGE